MISELQHTEGLGAYGASRQDIQGTVYTILVPTPLVPQTLN